MPRLHTVCMVWCDAMIEDGGREEMIKFAVLSRCTNNN